MSKSVNAKPSFDLDIELALVDRSAKRKIRVGANITFERLHKIIPDYEIYKAKLWETGKRINAEYWFD